MISRAQSGSGSGYGNPQVESRFLGMVTIENAAVLDASGKPYYPLVDVPGARFHSPLHSLLAGTYYENGHKITFKTDSLSEGKFRTATNEFPRFPFGFYALALALRSRHDPSWREYAEKAVSIFEKTTLIKDCNQNHFDALKELRGYLAEQMPSPRTP